jgi:16S rRNA (cytosine1402-N4)-methyltransferase
MPAPDPHLPVLYNEIIHALQPQREGFYVDSTLGAGGHAAGILEASQPDGRLLGLDLDPQAVQIASQRLAKYGQRIVIVQASYTSLQEQLERLGWQAVQGILLDLGVSSMQLDTPGRGFSFQVDSPLDMRFDPANPVTADQLVNNLRENDLADVIYRYGEERRAYQVARAIVRSRPIHTTSRLAEVISRATRGGRSGIHPATRTFQALRIAVNHELEALETVLLQAVASLAPAGRLAVISFHSLEDRMVKNFFRQESQDCICPPRQLVCTCGHRANLVVITRHPIRPSEDEIHANPRARSAKLRVVEKI